MDIKPFQAVYPNFDYITSPDHFFSTVKYDYPDYKESGFFHKTPQEAIYIYRISSKNNTHTGIVACATVEEYNTGKIKKHENTLASKEQQQLTLMLKRGAAVKPILLTYPDVKSIRKIVKKHTKNLKPFYQIFLNDDTEKHTFWKIEEGKDIQEIQEAFQDIPHVYIADGHHRSSTSALMARQMEMEGKKGHYDKILSAFFPVKELSIYDYNRVVEGLDQRTTAKFMALLSQVFNMELLEKAQKPKKKHELTMLIGEEWFKLRWKKEILDKYENECVILDANLLDNEVMKKIMEIEDTKTDKRISYVEGPKGFENILRKTRKDENKAAFCLYPVAIEDLFCIADAGQIMPPKSTWFEPRVKNGLLVLEF